MRLRTVWIWVALFVTAGVGLGIIAFPTFYIMPFKTQDARTLAWALTARTVAPALTLSAAAVAGALAICLAMRGRRWWSRLAPALLVVPVVFGAWFARQNHFEWMFNPLPKAAYAGAGEAGFVADRDMVMAVEVGGEAVAYPVRQMAYHHVVQDVVGGKPITATY